MDVVWCLKSSSVRFSSRWHQCVQKKHMRSTPSLRSFPKDAFRKRFQRCWSDWLMMAVSRPFKGDSSNAFSFHASLLRTIDGVVSLVLCPPWYNRAGWLDVKHQITYLPQRRQGLKLLNAQDPPRSEPLVMDALTADILSLSVVL